MPKTQPRGAPHRDLCLGARVTHRPTAAEAWSSNTRMLRYYLYIAKRHAIYRFCPKSDPNMPTHRACVFVRSRPTSYACMQMIPEERLQAILATIDNVVWSISADHYRTLYLNPAAERVYGREGLWPTG